MWREAEDEDMGSSPDLVTGRFFHLRSFFVCKIRRLRLTAVKVFSRALISIKKKKVSVTVERWTGVSFKKLESLLSSLLPVLSYNCLLYFSRLTSSFWK